jgi:Bacterial Ig-like domain
MAIQAEPTSPAQPHQPALPTSSEIIGPLARPQPVVAGLGQPFASVAAAHTLTSRSATSKSAKLLLAQVTQVNPEFADDANDESMIEHSRVGSELPGSEGTTPTQGQSQINRLRLIDLIEPTLHDIDRPGAVRIADIDDANLADTLASAGASNLVGLAPVAAIPWSAIAGVSAAGAVAGTSGSSSNAAADVGSSNNSTAPTAGGRSNSIGMADSVTSDNVINAREAAEAPTIGGRGISAGTQISVSIKQLALDGITVIGEVPVGSVSLKADGSWQLPVDTLAGLADGRYAVTIVAVDALGVRAETVQNFSIDKAPPAAPSVFTANPVTADATPTVSGADATPGDQIQVVSPTGEVLTTNVAADGTWSVTPSIELAAGGPRSFVITAIDAAGNISSPTFLPVSFTPLVVLSASIASSADSGTQGDSITNNVRPTLLGTGQPGASVTVATGTGELLSTTVADNGQWRVTLSSALAEGGPQKISVTSIDVNGATVSVSVPIIIDSSAPSAITALLRPGSDSGEAGDNLTNDTTPSLFGVSASPGDRIRVTTPTGEILPTVVGLDGTWGVTPAIALPGSGAQEFQFNVTDAAGNAGPTSTLVLNLDSSAPAVPQAMLDPAYANGATINGHTQTNKPTISGYHAAADELITVTSPTGEVLSTSIFADGSWCVTAQIELPAGGPHLFQVIATDRAGNVSPVTTVAVIVELPVAGNGVAVDHPGTSQNPSESLASYGISAMAHILPIDGLPPVL